MRIAIFHNYLDNIGGAQAVVFSLAKALKADVFSTVINQDAITQHGFADIRTTSIGWVPINAPLRQQMALARFRQLKLKNQYDFFINAGDWSLSGLVNNQPNLWYCHSPSRELWDYYTGTRAGIVPAMARPAFDIWVKYNRYLNKKYVGSANTVIASSKNAQTRLKEFLGVKADIIYPPVETGRYHNAPPQDYWLSVNRLIPYKRIELQLEVFRQLPNQKLIIVGAYEQSRHFKAYAKRIRASLPPNVALKSHVDFSELTDLYARCQGLITTSHNEDFGLNVIEAFASGKPVVAVNEGGYRETVQDGLTGRLVKADLESLSSAVKAVSLNPERYRKACQERAHAFDVKICIQKFQKHISKII